MKFALLSLLVIFFSQHSFGKTYLIKKGTHSMSGVGVGVKSGQTTKIKVNFGEGTDYDLGSPDQYDWNKLWGFADCSSHHHTNSARFGWRWSPERQMVEVSAYVYVNEERLSKSLGFVKQFEEAQLELRALDEEYAFTINQGEEIRLPRGCSGNGGVKYRLFPYFGGNNPAPHDVSIDVDELTKNGYVIGDFKVGLPYPNPYGVSDSLKVPIETGRRTEKLFVEVFDLLGRVLFRVPERDFLVIPGETRYVLELEPYLMGNLSAAMYFVRISNEHGEVGLAASGDLASKVIHMN